MTTVGKNLTSNELQIVHLVQHSEFANEIQELTKGSTLPANLQRLNPFLHEYSDMPLSFKLIQVHWSPRNSPVTTQPTLSVPTATCEGFKFIFIPPRASHFGGLWEVAVKSAKHLIIREMGNVLLTAEELGTLLSEMEAILNSRALAPLSQDPNDGKMLTPAHLLIGCSLRALPPAQLSTDPIRCCERWMKI
ncbi:uncharacterized protein [Bactrocera oleae]|uniref:uncharacterized protein n=1 Tax=Bactrocera oleae TaxID=104688 RepID=UPI00387ECE07